MRCHKSPQLRAEHGAHIADVLHPSASKTRSDVGQE